jgi:phosphatidylglycerophosphatase A
MSRFIATFAYVGLLRPAPGTWGSAAAIPVAVGLHGLGSFPLLFAASLALFPIGYWATLRATAGKDDHDPSEIVIDEVVGQWIAIWPVSFGMWQLGQASWTIPWQFLVVCFALFRLFDIWKPGPVGWADRRHNAMGVMLDDVVAGLLAAAVFFFGMLWQSWIFDFIEALQWLV